jgi:gliding motility-associated-like protein
VQVNTTVTINNPVTLDAGPDLTICEGTAVLLNIVSNASVFNWTPSAGLSNPSIKNPLAAPAITTSYIVTATEGLCVRADTILVIVRPAPIPDAGIDLRTCFGNSVRLDGKGGQTYQWTPAQNLSSSIIANPMFTATREGVFKYALSVTDANGCRSLVSDTVTITVLPPVKVDAGRDTSVAINQPLQLNAGDPNNSNFINYRWSPTVNLNNANLKNPVALFTNVSTIVYTVKATSVDGCEASDDIKITVFLKADIYVPNAFTPNHDGKNDLARPIGIGIKELKYFRLYNRWGELVFETKELTKGWDGVWKGVEQPTNTYVWMAQAIDFNGNLITKKGTITLVK